MNLCQTCGICCLSTEMQLSNEDIELIANKSELKKEDFCEFYDGFFRLKNVDGHCIFFQKETISCEIYNFRPFGCKLYPMIFDSEKNKCSLDDDCPHRKKFYRHKPEFQKKCSNLRSWVSKNFSHIL
jgi:uncharacterized protein